MGRTMWGMGQSARKRPEKVATRKPVYLKIPRITRHRAMVTARAIFRRLSSLPVPWMTSAPTQQMKTIPTRRIRYRGPDQE